ncbi:MAG: Sapep family Mn(2+)-dependent dipeptidase [Eubacteriaceae bacterium]|nr:Sapep family Mn(2+)-dependent dipeptidase [Eubacteriaceae bacterium]
MKEKFRQAAASYTNDIIEAIKRLVAINSTRSEPLQGMPFGQGPADALSEALKIASDLGFESVNMDNYCGYAKFGSGSEKIGVLAHLDIVPIGKGWEKDPLACEIEDGKIYGRGTSDDKGPAIMALYAMKILKDLGIEPAKEIRLIFGCAEETGMECMKHYREVEGDHFSFGFSPDSSFPVIFGEKGSYRAMASAPLHNSGDVIIAALDAGEAFNVVCPEAECCLAGPESMLDQVAGSYEEFALEKNFESKASIDNKGNLKLVFTGKSAHASMPELGISAVALMYEFLEAIVNEPIIKAFNSLVGYNSDGSGFGVADSDQYGALTLAVGMAKIIEGRLGFSIDIRYPITKEFSDEKIAGALSQYGAELSEQYLSEPLYADPQSGFIQSLLSAYVEHTQDAENKPFTIGGGTYSRQFSNVVAYGASFPGDENPNIHAPNEFLAISNIDKATAIYASALHKLLAL